MTALRIFQTARPSLVGARVIPMDPAEQAILDELSRRRASSTLAHNPTPASIEDDARVKGISK